MPEDLTEVNKRETYLCIDCGAQRPVADAWMCSDGKIRCGQHRQTFAQYLDPSNEDISSERARLERLVIEAAKEFTDDTELRRDNWEALVAYRELCRAVDALNNFESSQQQIKKGG